MQFLWKIILWGKSPGPAGSTAARADCFSRSAGTHVPSERKWQQHREPGWGQGILRSKWGPALHHARASCEDISPLSKTADVGLGATVIYFGNRLSSGLNGDPQNVGPSLNLCTCQWDLIWKTVFAEACSLLLNVKAQPSTTRHLETSEKSDRNLPKQ